MDILLKPDSLCLAGALNRFLISTTGDISFVLKYAETDAVVVQHTYTPNKQGRVEINLESIVTSLLTFKIQDVSEPYRQTSIVRKFTATFSEVSTSSTESWSFTVLRAGIDRFADSAANWLKANFLTWQPTVKPVTYYTPEFLTYYAQADSVCKCRAYVEKNGIYEETLLTMGLLSAGYAWTIPVQYAIIAGKTNDLPSYYDIWVENTNGERLTYIQRYYASDVRSEQEQWVLFENSLGGIDTFRAYGDSENTAKHTHNIAEIENDSEEYRVDTTREFKKNTGHLTDGERRWLLDFFPSLGKFLYAGTSIRRIVVTESDVNWQAKELPSSYTFTYKYADARPYLNLPRADMPANVLDIKIPDVGSFTVAPRLVELDRLPLSGGALFPVQSPYSDKWSVTTAAAIIDWLSHEITASYSGNGSFGHTHDNMSLLSALTRLGKYLLIDAQKIWAEYADEANVAKKLSNDSPVYDQFLRKDVDDTASGIIKFLRGLVARAKSFFAGIKNTGDIENDGNITNTGDITTKNLTVTGKATFFELEILKAKAAGGTTINSPGTFHADLVEDTDAGYVLYQRADQDGKTLMQMVEEGDQLFCCDFNVGTGLYTNAGNRYYWRRVTAAPTEYVTKSINGEEVRYLTVTISKTDRDLSSDDAPQIGDDLMVLGSRTNPDRQSAIMTSAYRSFDVGLTAPYTAQYIGINDYDLASHRRNYQAANGNKFVGRMEIVSNGSEAVSRPVPCERGAWTPGMECGYYDRVSYTEVDGTTSLYLCLVVPGTTTTEEPGKSDNWQKQVSGTSSKSTYTYIRYSNDGGQTFTAAKPWTETGDYGNGRNIVYDAGGDYTFIRLPNGAQNQWSSWKTIHHEGITDAETSLTFSGKVKFEGCEYPTGSRFIVRFMNQNEWSNKVFMVQPVSEDGVYDLTSTITNLPAATADNKIQLRVDYVNGGKATFYDLKVELGDKATPWAPAPEDTTFGTIEGAYMGVAVSDKPYPPMNVEDYTWSKTKGEPGESVAIDSSKSSVTYQVSGSGIVVPTGTWGTSVPAVDPGNFLWTKIVTAYTDGKSTTAYNVSRQGEDGASVQIQSAATAYAVTADAGQPADSAFSPDLQELNKGDYLWTRSTITFDDGSAPLVSYSVSRLGTDGENGVITHFAYATSADGIQGFSTTAFEGYTYIGVYTDPTEAQIAAGTMVPDPDTASSYTWTPVKGEDATYYFIAASQNVVHIDKDGNADVNTISVYGAYQDNGVIRAITDSSYTLHAYKDAETGDPVRESSLVPSFNLGVDVSATKYIVVLRRNGRTVNKLTIHVIKDGTAGETAFSITTSPGTVIINQSTSKSGNAYPLLIDAAAEGSNTEILLHVFRGSEEIPVSKPAEGVVGFSINTITPNHCTAVRTADNGTTYNDRVWINSVGTYAENGSNKYYRNGYVDLEVLYGNSSIGKVRVPFACNLNGEFKEVIDRDFSGRYASKTEFNNLSNNAITQSEMESAIEQKSDEILNTVQDVTDGINTQITTIRQTAQSISMKVGEVSERRNMLTGTAFRRLEEISWNNPSYPCMISTSVQYRGTNSVLIDCVAETNADGSAKDKWQGVIWRHIKVTPGKMYQWSFWYRTRTKDLTTEVKAFDANGKELNRPVSKNFLAGTNTDGTWHLFKVNFIPTDGTVTVDAMVYIIYSGKTYVARPMLEEADDYGGWTPSAQDYDYTGGNLIAGSRLFDGDRMSNGASTVTPNGFGEYSSLEINTSWEWKFGDIAKPNTEYIFSCYVNNYGDMTFRLTSGGSCVFAESSDGNVMDSARTDGLVTISAHNKWTRIWVHFKTSANVPSGTRIALRWVTSSNIHQIAAPKLEYGATVTDWTESADDKVSKAALLNTGIDIVNRKIKAIGDMFEWLNNQGEKKVFFDNNTGEYNFSGNVVATTFSGSNGYFKVLPNGASWSTGLINYGNMYLVDGIDDTDILAIHANGIGGAPMISFYYNSTLDNNGNPQYDRITTQSDGGRNMIIAGGASSVSYPMSSQSFGDTDGAGPFIAIGNSSSEINSNRPSNITNTLLNSHLLATPKVLTNRLEAKSIVSNMEILKASKTVGNPGTIYVCKNTSQITINLGSPSSHKGELYIFVRAGNNITFTGTNLSYWNGRTGNSITSTTAHEIIFAICDGAIWHLQTINN